MGESKHIERRFFTHYQNLLGGCHPNKGLSKALRINGIDSFFFLVALYGKDYEDLAFRREKEISLINSWPGSIYNRKDVR